jgi:single-stranded-DNA-specific exonuclease
LAAQLDDMLDLVCIGTIGDVVDLSGENRGLVASGLAVLRASKRPGLLSLAETARLNPGAATARDVAFIIAPRLNASARLQHGQLSLDLLRAPSRDVALPIALEIEALNRRRRQFTHEAVDAAVQFLGRRVETDRILVAVGSWIPGVSGLVASQLKERFGRPSVAICDRPPDGAAHADDDCVGSARSILGFDITSALQAVHGHLCRFGGHAGAAGFTLKRSSIPAFTDQLNIYAANILQPEDIGPRLKVDALLSVSDFTPDLRKQLERFEPCGQGNPQPLFLLQNVLPVPGSVREWENERFSFRIAGPSITIQGAGSGRILSTLLMAARPVDIVCNLRPSPDKQATMRIAMLDARAATP